MAVPRAVPDGGQHSYTWQFRSRLDHLAHYRRLARAAMRVWRMPPRATDVVVHGVTELLANVHRHAGDPRCELRLTQRDISVLVTVSDRSPVLPTVALPDWTAESGRGLWLLREMAADFGYGPAPGGKSVWIRVDAGQREEGHRVLEW